MNNSKILILGRLICCHGNLCCSCDVTGGGDGAALREVLNYNPNMVIMIEVGSCDRSCDPNTVFRLTRW